MIDHQVRLARADFYRRSEAALGDPALRNYVRQHRIDLTLTGGFCGQQAILPVADCGGGRFDFLDGGETFPAFVCEAYDRDGETTIDLVAWPLDRPQHVMTMFGRAALMGLWQALNPYAYTFGRPLVMHRTPLDWLMAECNGAAIVVPHLAARVLRDLPDISGTVACQDAAHGREIARLIEGASRTRVLVPNRRAA